MTTNRLARHALVTGASSGIGKAYARALAARGSDLTLVARDESRLQALAGELRAAHGCTIDVLCADLIHPDQRGSVEQRLRDDGTIDLLINNAGYGDTGVFAARPIDAVQGQIDLNITALTRLAHAALGSMRKARRGGILNVASGAAFLPTPNMAVYAATKAYVLSFTQGVAEEAKADNVKVTVVCPGFTRTEFQERANYDTSALPAMAWQTAEQVVRESLDAHERGHVLCVPGVQNRVLMSLLHFVPRSALVPLVARFSRQPV